MNKGKLEQESIEFSIEIINYSKWLVEFHKEFILSKQILRSGTSIGANIHEATYAASRADFVSKLQIALKEAAETEYWMIVLKRTGYASANFDHMEFRLTAIKKMLTASINTAKN